MSLGKISVPEHQIVTGSQSIATADFFSATYTEQHTGVKMPAENWRCVKRPNNLTKILLQIRPLFSL